MQNQFSRTRLLLGKPAIDTLNDSRVAVFGVRGVGGYVVEILARSGVGATDVIDGDRVCLTNINQQLLTTTRTVGKHEVDVAEEYTHSINPRCIMREYQTFYSPDNVDQFDFSRYDYVIDYVDTVTAKLDLICRCHEISIPLLSRMGVTYKLGATQFRVTDILGTINDPLAKVIRKKLRRTKIKHPKVIHSPEEPLESVGQPEISYRFHYICPDKDIRKCTGRRTIPSSSAQIPAAVGPITDGKAVKDLTNLASTMRIRPEDKATGESARIAHKRIAEMLKKHKCLKAEKAATDK